MRYDNNNNRGGGGLISVTGLTRGEGLRVEGGEEGEEEGGKEILTDGRVD